MKEQNKIKISFEIEKPNNFNEEEKKRLAKVLQGMFIEIDNLYFTEK